MSASCAGGRRLMHEGVGEQHRALAGEQDGQAEQHASRASTSITREISSSASKELRVTPGHHRIGIAAGHHAGGEHVAVLVHQALAVAVEHALALLAAHRGSRCSACCAATAGHCGSRGPRRSQAHRRHRRLDALLAADQHRRAVAAVRRTAARRGSSSPPRPRRRRRASAWRAPARRSARARRRWGRAGRAALRL